MKLERISDVVWELGKRARPDMNVPVRVLADEELMAHIQGDKSLEQLVNVATLPGVVRVALVPWRARGQWLSNRCTTQPHPRYGCTPGGAAHR